jgi:hypothetical protein
MQYADRPSLQTGYRIPWLGTRFAGARAQMAPAQGDPGYRIYYPISSRDGVYVTGRPAAYSNLSGAAQQGKIRRTRLGPALVIAPSAGRPAQILLMTRAAAGRPSLQVSISVPGSAQAVEQALASLRLSN